MSVPNQSLSGFQARHAAGERDGSVEILEEHGVAVLAIVGDGMPARPSSKVISVTDGV
jgi:hypothetical protein